MCERNMYEINYFPQCARALLIFIEKLGGVTVADENAQHLLLL